MENISDQNDTQVESSVIECTGSDIKKWTDQDWIDYGAGGKKINFERDFPKNL